MLQILFTYNVPIVIDKFVKFMLENLLLIRLNAYKAVLICQILGWAPKAWTSGEVTPSSQDILQWTMTMTTKVIYECNFTNSVTAHSEYQLVLIFLSRVTVDKIKDTLSTIKYTISESSRAIFFVSNPIHIQCSNCHR